MREGRVIFVDECEIDSKDETDILEYIFRTPHGDSVYTADIVICGDKIIKNRFGKQGTIMEPYVEIEVDQNRRFILDILNLLMEEKGVSI